MRVRSTSLKITTNSTILRTLIKRVGVDAMAALVAVDAMVTLIAVDAIMGVMTDAIMDVMTTTATHLLDGFHHIAMDVATVTLIPQCIAIAAAAALVTPLVIAVIGLKFLSWKLPDLTTLFQSYCFSPS